jgi:hypothetical protein
MYSSLFFIALVLNNLEPLTVCQLSFANQGKILNLLIVIIVNNKVSCKATSKLALARTTPVTNVNNYKLLHTNLYNLKKSLIRLPLLPLAHMRTFMVEKGLKCRPIVQRER